MKIEEILLVAVVVYFVVKSQEKKIVLPGEGDVKPLPEVSRMLPYC